MTLKKFDQGFLLYIADKKALKDYFVYLFPYVLVGEERIELSLLAKHDFESCASTSSAIRPLILIKLYLNSIRTKIILKPKNVSNSLQKMFRLSIT